MTADRVPPLADLADGRLAVGVDVGGTKTQAVLFVRGGRVDTVTRPTARGVEGVIGTVRDVTQDLLRATGAQPDLLSAVGIGIPGVVDSARGTVSHGVNVGLDRDDVPLARRAADVVGAPVLVANDVTAATLGAAHALGVDGDAALLSIGTGLAAGILLDGRVRPGAHGNAGEIGHIPYRLDGPPCACGQVGCLELYASGSALARMYPAPGGVAPAAHLFDRVDAGDARARAAHSEWMGALAHAVEILGLTIDVDVILLAGGVTRSGDRLVADLREELTRRAEGSAFLRRADLASRLVLVDPELGAAPLGACLLALQDLAD